MTLIAMTLNHGFPVLIADVLVSSEKSDGNIKTPTFIEGIGSRLSHVKGAKPVTLKQKIYVINDRLCIALAGRLDQMYIFLNEVKQNFSNIDFNVNEFCHFFENYPNSKKTKLAVFAIVTHMVDRKLNWTPLIMGNTTRQLENNRYQIVYAAGTGAKSFLEFLETNPAFDTDITGVDGPLVMNQYLIGYWLAQETSRLKTLKEQWGAGFEMIILKDGKFIKLSEYTAVFLTATISKEIEFQPKPSTPSWSTTTTTSMT